MALQSIMNAWTRLGLKYHNINEAWGPKILGSFDLFKNQRYNFFVQSDIFCNERIRTFSVIDAFSLFFLLLAFFRLGSILAQKLMDPVRTGGELARKNIRSTRLLVECRKNYIYLQQARYRILVIHIVAHFNVWYLVQGCKPNSIRPVILIKNNNSVTWLKLTWWVWGILKELLIASGLTTFWPNKTTQTSLETWLSVTDVTTARLLSYCCVLRDSKMLQIVLH